MSNIIKSAIRFFYPEAFPQRQVELGQGVARFVAVRFFLPDAGSVVQVYDRENSADLSAWDQNQALYRCQVQGYAASKAALVETEVGDKQ